MAYTICDLDGNPKELRLVGPVNGDPMVHAPIKPYWWNCDPCNPARARYEVQFSANQAKPTEYTWYEVVTTDDTEADIQAKIAHYRRVISARDAMERARKEYASIACE